MAAMMQKRAAFANRSLSAVSPSTRNLVVARYAQTLSAGDLAAFKIIDLVDIAKKKGVSGGRDATRDTLTRAILQKGVSMSDLTRGQLAELKAKNPSAGSNSGGYSAPSEGRFSSYSNGTSSAGHSAGRSSGTTLSAGDLSAFKNADLAEIASKKGVSGGRNATRDALTQSLVRAGVTLNDLTRGQLVDLGIKLGKAGLSRDINRARAELAALIGGSGSAPASWRSTPAPAASSGDRWSSYSRSTPASSGGRAGSSSGAKLSASDLVNLPIDDLRDLVSKTGAELPREPTKQGVINALVGKGVSLDHLTRGMLVALSTKLGAPLAKDINGLKANLSSRIGGGSSGGSSWRSTPAPSSNYAPAAGGDRWAKYSAGSTQAASWRRSGSHNASGSKLSASDLAVLRIDDLRDLVKKTGAQLPREPTKEGVVSALLQKSVSLNDLTRGMLVDLANKLGTPLARDVDSLRKNLSSAVGKGSYSPSSSSTSTSSWRSAPATPAPANTDRWASYSRGGSNGSSGRSSGSGAVYEADLQGFKIDMLSEMARKIGIPMRNATKDSLVSQLVKSITLNDLSRGQLIEILSNINQSTSGSVADLRSRVAAAASQRQSARSRSLAGARW